MNLILEISNLISDWISVLISAIGKLKNSWIDEKQIPQRRQVLDKVSGEVERVLNCKQFTLDFFNDLALVIDGVKKVPIITEVVKLKCFGVYGILLKILSSQSTNKVFDIPPETVSIIEGLIFEAATKVQMEIAEALVLVSNSMVCSKETRLALQELEKSLQDNYSFEDSIVSIVSRYSSLKSLWNDPLIKATREKIKIYDEYFTKLGMSFDDRHRKENKSLFEFNSLSLSECPTLEAWSFAIGFKVEFGSLELAEKIYYKTNSELDEKSFGTGLVYSNDFFEESILQAKIPFMDDTPVNVFYTSLDDYYEKDQNKRVPIAFNWGKVTDKTVRRSYIYDNCVAKAITLATLTLELIRSPIVDNKIMLELASLDFTVERSCSLIIQYLKNIRDHVSFYPTIEKIDSLLVTSSFDSVWSLIQDLQLNQKYVVSDVERKDFILAKLVAEINNELGSTKLTSLRRRIFQINRVLDYTTGIFTEKTLYSSFFNRSKPKSKYLFDFEQLLTTSSLVNQDFNLARPDLYVKCLQVYEENKQKEINNTIDFIKCLVQYFINGTKKYYSELKGLVTSRSAALYAYKLQIFNSMRGLSRNDIVKFIDAMIAFYSGIGNGQLLDLKEKMETILSKSVLRTFTVTSKQDHYRELVSSEIPINTVPLVPKMYV